MLLFVSNCPWWAKKDFLNFSLYKCLLNVHDFQCSSSTSWQGEPYSVHINNQHVYPSAQMCHSYARELHVLILPTDIKSALNKLTEAMLIYSPHVRIRRIKNWRNY